MELSLVGHLSYVKYGKLHFTWLDEADETSGKLSKIAGLPHNTEGFSVSMPKSYKTIPSDIISMVGLDCKIKVKVVKYSLISKLERNRGERVTGSTLVLRDISKIHDV